MKVRVFDLCDYCIERDGLLTMVNGGINLLQRSSFPSTLDCDLAISLEAEMSIHGVAAQCVVTLTSEDGQKVAVPPLNIDIDVAPPPSGQRDFAQVGDPIVVTRTVSGKAVKIGEPGGYGLTLTVDGEVLSHLRFEVVLEPEEPPHESIPTPRIEASN